MRRLYKTFLPSLILLSIFSSPSYGVDIKDFKLESEILSNGDISLTSSLNKTNNTCIYLSYIQILRNYESAIDTDIDGTPILSRWETVWENTAINKYDTKTPAINAQRAKKICQSNNQNNSLSGAIISTALNLIGAEESNSESTFQTNSFLLKQGEEFLGSKMLNQSSNYEDAELKVSAIYIKTPSVNIFQFTPSGPDVNNGSHKVSTQVINLLNTKDEVEQVANHNFKYPGFVQGKKMPLAYLASDQNKGCLGRIMPVNNNASSQPNPGENPALRQNNTSTNNSPKYDCFYATKRSQKANQVPQVTLRDRTKKDLLIMCPGSTISDELSYNKVKQSQFEIPTSKASSYLQVLAEGNPRWCNYIEKAERNWSNLHSVSNEGWMVSLNPNTKTLECVAKQGECANTLYDNSNLKNMIKQPASLVKVATLALTGQGTRSCQYKDGSSADCPEQFNKIEHKTVNDLIQALQFESMRQSIH